MSFTTWTSRPPTRTPILRSIAKTIIDEQQFQNGYMVGLLLEMGQSAGQRDRPGDGVDERAAARSTACPAWPPQGAARPAAGRLRAGRRPALRRADDRPPPGRHPHGRVRGAARRPGRRPGFAAGMVTAAARRHRRAATTPWPAPRPERPDRRLRGHAAGRRVIGCTDGSSLRWAPPLVVAIVRRRRRRRPPALHAHRGGELLVARPRRADGTSGARADQGALTDTPSIHVAAGDRTTQPTTPSWPGSSTTSSRSGRPLPDHRGRQAYTDFGGRLWPVGPPAQDVPGCGERQTPTTGRSGTTPSTARTATSSPSTTPRSSRTSNRASASSPSPSCWPTSGATRSSIGGTISFGRADRTPGGLLQPGPGWVMSRRRRRRAGTQRHRPAPGHHRHPRVPRRPGDHRRRSKAPTGAPSIGSAASRTGCDDGVAECDAYAAGPPGGAGAAVRRRERQPGWRRPQPRPPGGHAFPPTSTASGSRVRRQSGRAPRSHPDSRGVRRRAAHIRPAAGLTAADFKAGVVYCPNPEFVAYERGRRERPASTTPSATSRSACCSPTDGPRPCSTTPGCATTVSRPSSSVTASPAPGWPTSCRAGPGARPS